MAHVKTLVLGSAVALALSVSQAAWAQLRVTVKPLNKPLAAQSCKDSGSLNERGDAVVVCSFAAGSRWVPWYPLSVFGFQKLETWYADKLVYWPAAGGSRVLNSPGPISITGPVLTAGSEVLAIANPVLAGGPVLIAPKAYRWTTATNTGTVAEYLPAGPAMPIGSFYKQPGDEVYLVDKQVNRWRIGAQGELGQVPNDLPTIAEPVVASGLMFYAAGSGARVARLGTPGTAFEGSIGEYQYWWGDGQRWRAIRTPEGAWPWRLDDMNASGVVVASGSGLSPFLWDPATGVATYLPGLDGRNFTRMLLNDQGVVAGHIQVVTPGVPDLPVVWWQGQVVELNKVAKLPTNMVLTDIKAINNRNQLLVWAEDKTRARNGRFMLLTLQ